MCWPPRPPWAARRLASPELRSSKTSGGLVSKAPGLPRRLGRRGLHRRCRPPAPALLPQWTRPSPAAPVQTLRTYDSPPHMHHALPTCRPRAGQARPRPALRQQAGLLWRRVCRRRVICGCRFLPKEVAWWHVYRIVHAQLTHRRMWQPRSPDHPPRPSPSSPRSGTSGSGAAAPSPRPLFPGAPAPAPSGAPAGGSDGPSTGSLTGTPGTPTRPGCYGGSAGGVAGGSAGGVAGGAAGSNTGDDDCNPR